MKHGIGLISFLLALIVASSVLSLGAAATDCAPAMTVGTVYASAGETVEVPVFISDNPGFNAFTMSIDYDDGALTLVSVSLDPAVGGQLYTSKRIIWLNTEDYSGNGTFMTLKFTVSDSAEGAFPISLSYEPGDVCSYYEEDVDLIMIPGSVSIKYPGDSNSDGKLNTRDLVLMKKYISGAILEDEITFENADVNGDNKINSRDVAALKILLTL